MLPVRMREVSGMSFRLLAKKLKQEWLQRLPVAVGNAAMVDLGKNDAFGSFLVDDKGMTLYLFTKDTPEYIQLLRQMCYRLAPITYHWQSRCR